MSLENRIEQLKKAAVEALHKSRGNVSAACAACGIGRTQFYQWKKDDEEFAHAVDNVREIEIDKVESKLLDKIDDGDITAIIFYLKTIGKKRGYVERQEITADVSLTKKPAWFDDSDYQTKTGDDKLHDVL